MAIHVLVWVESIMQKFNCICFDMILDCKIRVIF